VTPLHQRLNFHSSLRPPLFSTPEGWEEGEADELAAKARRLEEELARLQEEIQKRKGDDGTDTKKGVDRYGLKGSSRGGSGNDNSGVRPRADPRALERKILFDVNPDDLRSSRLRRRGYSADDDDGDDEDDDFGVASRSKTRDGRQAFIESDPIWDMTMKSKGRSGMGGSSGKGNSGKDRVRNFQLGAEKNSALRDSEVVDQLLSALKGPAAPPRPKRDLDKVAEMLKARYSSKLKTNGQSLSSSSPFDSKAITRSGESELTRIEVRDALRQGVGVDLLKRVMSGVDEGVSREEVVKGPDGEPPSRIERLAAWGQLVVEVVANQGYSMTMDTMLRARELADCLLPFDEFSQREVTTTNLAVIQEIAGLISREVPLRKKNAGSNMYVLLRLPFNGIRDPVMMHQEETLIGEIISLYSSVGLGGRMVVESSMNDVMVGKQRGADLLLPENFDRAVQDLKEFGGAIQDFFRTMRLPKTQAMDGLADNLNFWMRQLMQEVLSTRDNNKDVVNRMMMLLELALAVADTLMIAQGTYEPDLHPFNPAYEEVWKEKLRDLATDVPNRSALLKTFLTEWMTQRLTGSRIATSFTAKPLRLDTRDIRMWDLARTLLNQNDLELFFYAKEVTPNVLGHVMADALIERKGEWPQGEEMFQDDFEEIYRRLKFDKFEGSDARCKAIRNLAEAVMDKGGSEEEKQKAIDWGCRLLFMYRDDFDVIAKRQGAEDLKAHVLQHLLPKGDIAVNQIVTEVKKMTERLGIDKEDESQAAGYALQTHIAQLASSAVWADFEGQSAKSFNSIVTTVEFIEETAIPVAEALGFPKEDLCSGLARDDAKQLAGICSRMMGRKHYSRAGMVLLDLLGYATEGLY